MIRILFVVSLLILSTLSFPEKWFPVTEEEIEEARKAMQRNDLYGGDMMGIPKDGDRSNALAALKKWPNGTIYYEIDSSLSSISTLIHTAMDTITKQTGNCIKFAARTNQANYVHLQNGNGCNSYVGMIGGKQITNLQLNGCNYVGTIIHELTHSIGFEHEHQRPDRDNYLTIHMENVQSGDESQFTKFATNQVVEETAFDYASIMIYGPKSFSKNGQDTIVTKGTKIDDAYNKKEESANDVTSIKKLYGC